MIIRYYTRKRIISTLLQASSVEENSSILLRKVRIKFHLYNEQRKNLKSIIFAEKVLERKMNLPFGMVQNLSNIWKYIETQNSMPLIYYKSSGNFLISIIGKQSYENTLKNILFLWYRQGYQNAFNQIILITVLLNIIRRQCRKSWFIKLCNMYNIVYY